MKNALAVFKKELRRFFTDQMTLLALCLPGIILFVLYTILGDIINSSIINAVYSPSETSFTVAYGNNSGSETPLLISAFDAAIDQLDANNEVTYLPLAPAQKEEAMQKVSEGEYMVYISFTDSFETNVLSGKEDHNNVSVYYDASSELSSFCYNLTVNLVSTIYDSYTVNFENGEYVDTNLGETDYLISTVTSFVVPMVLVSLLFSTVMQVCPESIAGEKERGSIGTLLMTSARRGEIVLGKTAALFVVSFFSGLISFLGLIFSFPNMMGGGMDFSALFSPAVVISLLFLILTALILYVSLGAFLSTLAKSVKEATAYIGPLMVPMMALAVLPMAIDLSNIGFAFVPFLNVLSSMSLLLKGAEIGTLLPYIGITIGMNILISAIFIYFMKSMFGREKTMFAN